MSDKRLIDANALPVHWGFISYDVGIVHGRFVAVDDIEDAPTIDALPVVRCKDCKHAIVNENHIDKPLICCKTKMVGTTDPDWFCAAGERKDGGASDAAD